VASNDKNLAFSNLTLCVEPPHIRVTMMASRSALLASARARFVFGIAALALSLAACAGADPTFDAEPVIAAPGDPSSDLACTGDDPASFCDDCNPCTTDANCTPCSALPAAERDIYHCTADDELPAFCAGRTGCVHVPFSTPAGQIDDCFPVVESVDLHAGACLAGVCVDNPVP
jgi:hypothetical protein